MAAVAMTAEWCGPAVVSASGFRPCEHDRVRAWALVSAVQGGDRDAFGVLWQRYVQAVQRVVRRSVPDEMTAEDLTSETFLTALRRIDHAQDRGVDVLAWLFWLARGVISEHYRRVWVHREVPVDEFDEVAEYGTPERVVLRELDQAAVVGAVQAAVATLTPSQRLMVQMCDLDEHTVSEAAAASGRSEQAVRNHRSRGRRALATALAPWAPSTRQHVSAAEQERVAHCVALSPPTDLPPADAAVATTIATGESVRSPYRARLHWVDPVTGGQRSVSRSWARYGEAAAWIQQMLMQRATTVASQRPAPPDQVDAVESADGGWLVAA